MSKTHIVLHDLNHSGVAHAAVVLANGMADNNMPVRLVVIGLKNKTPYDINNSVELVFLNIERNKTYIPRSALALNSYFKTEKPEHIFVWGKEFSCVVLALRCLFKYKFKVTAVSVQSIAGHLKYGKGVVGSVIHDFVYKLMLKAADGMIAQSDGMVPELADNYLISKDKISVVYPPISQDFFDADLTNNKKEEIVFVGRLSAQKSPQTLLRIFSDKRFSKYKLRMVGCGELDDQLIEYTKSLNIADRVIFEGAKSNVIPYLQRAKVLVLTSKFEGFGMVLAESIACGTPIVSFDCPVGPSDIVIDGKNGYLIKNGDEKEFAEKLLLALKKDWNAENIRKTADKFRPEVVLRGYLAVINS